MATDNVNKEVTVFERISSGGPETVNAALDMLEAYGYPEPTDRKELNFALATAALEKGEDALKQMANFHPDKDFIISNLAPALTSASLPSSPPPSNTNASGKQAVAGHHYDCGGCKQKYADIGNLESGSVAAPSSSAEAKSSAPGIEHYAMVLVLVLGGFAVISMMLAHSHLHSKH